MPVDALRRRRRGVPHVDDPRGAADRARRRPRRSPRCPARSPSASPPRSPTSSPATSTRSSLARQRADRVARTRLGAEVDDVAGGDGARRCRRRRATTRSPVAVDARRDADAASPSASSTRTRRPSVAEPVAVASAATASRSSSRPSSACRNAASSSSRSTARPASRLHAVAMSASSARERRPSRRCSPMPDDDRASPVAPRPGSPPACGRRPRGRSATSAAASTPATRSHGLGAAPAPAAIVTSVQRASGGSSGRSSTDTSSDDAGRRAPRCGRAGPGRRSGGRRPRRAPSGAPAARLVEQVAVRRVDARRTAGRRRSASASRVEVGAGRSRHRTRRIRRPHPGRLEGRTLLRKDPDREPGRDRGPRHAHVPRARHRDRRGVLRARPRRRCTCATPTRRTRSAGRPRPRATSTPTRSSTRSSSRGADGVHPGYGFFSENADFARAITAAGVAWIGPPPEAIEVMGDKISSRQAAAAADVESVPGTLDADHRRRARSSPSARSTAGPIAIKAAYGGGGRGMKVVHERRRARSRRSSPRTREAQAYFGRVRVLPRALPHPARATSRSRSSADTHGNGVWLGERDCSTQRRHQKLIEEAPAPALADETRTAMGEAAVKVALGVRLRQRRHRRDALPGRRVLLPRDEHAAPGRALRHRGGHRRSTSSPSSSASRPASRCRSPRTSVERRGHSIECRINAEDPAKGFLPSPGTITRLRLPVGPGRALGRRLRRGRHDLAVLRQPHRQARRVGARPRRARSPRMLRALGEFEIEGVAHDDPRAPRAARPPRLRAPASHSTKWVEDEVDASLFAAAPAPRRDRARPTTASDAALVERTVPVEVDGKRFTVQGLAARRAGRGARRRRRRAARPDAERAAAAAAAAATARSPRRCRARS